MNDAANKLPSIAIVGRPNVGKSALFNRLIRRKVAIVHDQPGITRDRISAVCASGTRPFVLWDTGGIFGAGEAELTRQVRRTAEEAFRGRDPRPTKRGKIFTDQFHRAQRTRYRE